MTGRGMYCTKADGMITKLYAARDALSAVIDALSNEVAHIEGDNRALVEQARDLESENAALEAQAAIGRLAEEYVLAVHAEHEVETLGLDQEAFGAEWERRWDVADAVYVRLREAVDAALAARKGE